MVFLGIYRSDLQKQFKNDDFGHKNDLQNIVKKGLDLALQGKKNSHFWPIL